MEKERYCVNRLTCIYISLGSSLTLPAPEIGGSSMKVGLEGLSSAGTQELSWMPDSSGPMPVMKVPQLGALTEGIWSRATTVVAPLE